MPCILVLEESNQAGQTDMYTHDHRGSTLTRRSEDKAQSSTEERMVTAVQTGGDFLDSVIPVQAAQKLTWWIRDEGISAEGAHMLRHGSCTRVRLLNNICSVLGFPY